MAGGKKRAKGEQRAKGDQGATGDQGSSGLSEGVRASSGDEPKRRPFTPETLDRTVIAIPLLERIKQENPNAKGAKRTWAAGRSWHVYPIIIDLNLEFPGGRVAAREQVKRLVHNVLQDLGIDLAEQGIHEIKSKLSHQYLFAQLEGRAIEELVRRDVAAHDAGITSDSQGVTSDSQTQVSAGNAIYRIWPDFEIHGLTTKSVSTVKADAAHNAFAALGDGIVWAVLDSGIDGTHPHFDKHKNLRPDPPLDHYDFTVLRGRGSALVDVYGHGTHVAGIIAGARTESEGPIEAEIRYRDESGEVRTKTVKPSSITGMAPKCKLLSFKVLNDDGQGTVSNLIAALEAIHEVNGYGRRIRIHGVNMSVGYDFEPEWFACGQSPLCVEVDRLVRSGVVIVVAAGNTGYGWNQSAFRGAVAAGMDLTINDPGNAEQAITVGSTHREMPHIYGVSYFSSKGPTGDGRRKPDLVAPGEKIISAASSGAAAAAAVPTTPPPPPVVQPVEAQTTERPKTAELDQMDSSRVDATTASTMAGESNAGAPIPAQAPPSTANAVGRYREDSGTSMAAPHVSGVIAAFLSIRREFIGRPEALKQIFMQTATDLNREPHFQGRGLVDLMRAIQAV